MELKEFLTELREYWKKSGESDGNIADKIGMDSSTFSRKLRQKSKQNFTTTEIEAIIRILVDNCIIEDKQGQDLLLQLKIITDRPLGSITRASSRVSLPAQLTSFIGREKDIEKGLELLRQPDLRLLTITGSGGVGKTRFALQLALQISSAFKDGVYFVPLADVEAASLIPLMIARKLAIQELETIPIILNLKNYIQNKNLLLILDNFEHLTSGAPLVSELLTDAAGLKVIVTTRELLNLYGEYTFEMTPLEVPEKIEGCSAKNLRKYSAIELFEERAKTVDYTFPLTDENAPIIAQICNHLEGMPLAIELAASKCKTLKPRALLKELSLRLELKSNMVNVPPRQRGLRGMIDWSYDLLDERDQKLFTRLSVFAGGFTCEAAKIICNYDKVITGDFPEQVFSLLEKSLIHKMETSGDEGRFTMLEIIREYGKEKLVEAGEIEVIEANHAAYYLRLAELAGPALQQNNPVGWLSRLEEEQENLRSSLRFSVINDPAKTALKMANALIGFWQIRGYFTEGWEWLERVLANSSEEETVERLNVLLGAANFRRMQGDYAGARMFAESGFKLADKLGDEKNKAICLVNIMGPLDLHTGNYPAAKISFQTALVIFTRIELKMGVAAGSANLGLIAKNEGDYKLATDLYSESLKLAREIGHPTGQINCLNMLGVLQERQQNFEMAKTHYEEALSIERDLDDRPNLAITLNNLGIIAEHNREYDILANLYTESLQILRDGGNKEILACCFEGVASALAEKGYVGQAARLWGAAAAIRESIGAVFPHDELAEYTMKVDKAHSKIENSLWKNQWEAGRRITVAGGVEFALECLSSLQS